MISLSISSAFFIFTTSKNRIMPKSIRFFFLSLFLFPITYGQSLPTPEQFFGYKLGSRYTPHYRILQYFEALAKASPDMMKIQHYGKTYEGRPLMVAFISLPENISKLSAVQINNQRLAGVARDKMMPSEDAPAIVWLSYNVHGNEPSSSEAALKTVFALLDPANTKTKTWLKNTIVIIDPCINPDGRDRYVNWFSSVTDITPDPDPKSREHQEPWPGGRTNHYNFDLNRDWAWQSQVETQQRIKLFNEWLPQIHVDFHEQGYNEPYYFAPAAEPYHEVITPWQREFQVMIGRNNARYFDTNNWLYFTKERFDLFYPSYGDTYPTYSGAIGMTYEQGGIRGGLAIINEDGDTLTLADRLEHHYTTSLSTIEIASGNSVRLIKEYRKYFSDALANGTGEYKTFIIHYDGRPDVQSNLKTFLDNNGIEYQFATSKKSVKAYDYITGKEESRNIDINDLVISSYQAKSALVKVLFEPRSRITDSSTYDITAWSVPYAWGLEAYAAKERIIGSPFRDSTTRLAGTLNKETRTALGYVIPWNSFSSAKLLSKLIQQDIKVRYAEQAFTLEGKKFEKGTLIVLKTSNGKLGENLEKILQKSAGELGLQSVITPVFTGFVDKGYDFGSPRVRMINKPKIALITGEGIASGAAGEIWHYFEQQLKYPLSLINQSNVSAQNLQAYDVIIMPDGNYKFLNDKSSQDILRAWITQGGKVIAIEAAMSQLAQLEWGIKIKKDEDKKDDDTQNLYERIKQYENRERDYLPNSMPGAVYKLDLDNSHPLGFGYPGYYFTLKMDDKIYEFLKDGWNVGVIKKENYVSGFAGSKTKIKLKDGLLLGVYPMGGGNIVYMADDPIFRSFWESGKLLLANAIFMVE
jgi:Zinc carboxypeptidase